MRIEALAGDTYITGIVAGLTDDGVTYRPDDYTDGTDGLGEREWCSFEHVKVLALQPEGVTLGIDLTIIATDPIDRLNQLAEQIGHLCGEAAALARFVTGKADEPDRISDANSELRCSIGDVVDNARRPFDDAYNAAAARLGLTHEEGNADQ